VSRPAAVYLAMICVLILGLWAVLEIGNNYLSAPEDMAGKWQIQSASSSDPFGPGMNVEQSGKFFQVAFDHGPQLDLTMQSTSPMVLTNPKWKLTITGRDGSDDKKVRLEGPQTGQWLAHRTVRTFPPDTAAPTTKEAK
jgi:hypothetical protein